MSKRTQNFFEVIGQRKEQDVLQKHMEKTCQEINPLKCFLTVTLKSIKNIIKRGCHFHYNALSCVKLTQSLSKT